MSLPIILAAGPFILFLFLLLIRKTPLVWVAFITLILVIISAVFYWQVYPAYIYGSLVKGFLVACDIFFIIFGAIFFLEIMRETKIIENIGYHLESISKDIRIQVIFLAWFFENFLEGTAGFGTPLTVVAPLLIGLGISPINSVIIALLGNSASGVFGAVGTPIKVGFSGVAGLNVPLFASLANTVGLFVPLFIMWFLLKDKVNGKHEFVEIIPFALWSGIAFVVPSIFAVSIGQEFPSVLGSLIGLGLVFITTRLGIFIPKKEKEMLDSPHPFSISLLKVFFPYLLLITFLVIGKFSLGSSGFVITNIIKHTITFFNPGFAFIITGVIVILIYKFSFKFFKTSIKLSISRSIEPFLVIAFMSIMAQIMVTSVNNISGNPSMIESLAIHIKNTFLPFWAPIVGAFGSFLTGSVTVSNLMFGNFLAAASRQIGFDVDKILAFTVVGAAAGNMIALGDLVTAEAVVGLKNKERSILAGVIIPCLTYVVLVGLLALMFI